MIKKSFRATLAVILIAAFSIPITACQNDASTSSASTAQTYRWENFDDGSGVLSLSAPYIPANASDFAFDIILEQGRFAQEITSSQLALAGAIEGWQVESMQRTDDVTAAVVIHNPDVGNSNGAAIAQFALDADAVEIEVDETIADEVFAAEDDSEASDGQGNVVEDEMTSDEINEEKGVEWPTNDSSVVIEDADVEGLDEADADEVADGQNEDEGVPEAYVVAAVFANPYLNLEENTLSLNGDKLTFKMTAVDFVLDGRCTKQDFSIVDANGESSDVSIENVSVGSSSEIEVELAVANANVDSLDEAYIVLSANANETGAQVEGAIGIPDPYLSLSMDYRDDEKTVFVATLNGTDDKVAAGNAKVLVDGSQVQDATVLQGVDSEYEVTVPASAIQSDSTVEVVLGSVKNYAGKAVGNVAAASAVEDVEDARDLLDDIGMDIAKKALSSLATMGWNGLTQAMFASDSSVLNAKADELLAKVMQVEGQLANVNQRLTSLYDTVEAGQYETIVNNSNDLISKIYNQECLLNGKLRKFYDADSDDERRTAVEEVYSANRSMVDDLAVNLGVLHDKIMKASSRSGKDLIQVFDDMCASTYNWASQTYKSRQQFRNEVAVVWTEGAFLVDTIYGYAAEEDQRVNLDRFDTMTKSISELINNTRSIDETSCKKTKDKDVAYYNYTTGKWFSTTLGTASSKGWNEACIKYHKKGLHVTAATPFTNYSVKTKKYSANKNALSASGAYGTTAEVKAMVNRLRNGDTLEAEFKGVGLTCAKYLITSERLDGSYMIRYSYNDWYMDTFEIANAKADGSGFTHDKKHYDGRVGKRNKGHSNWYTKPAEMFVLKYVTF